MTRIPLSDAEPGVRRLTRSHHGRWSGGVCGLGRYFDVCPTIYRIVFAASRLRAAPASCSTWPRGSWSRTTARKPPLAEQALRPRPAGVRGLLAFAAIVLLAHAAYP